MMKGKLEGANLMGTAEATVSQLIDHGIELCSEWKERKTCFSVKGRLRTVSDQLEGESCITR